jgi:hypothetical protein
MINLIEELKAVTEALEKGGIPYALVGGLAYSIWVEARATEDIDLLILPDDWERIPPLLGPLGYQDLAGPVDLRQIRIRRLTKLEGEEVFVADFLLADTPELAEGVKQAPRIKHLDREYPVAKPGVVISMKQGRMSAKDRNDIEGLRKLIEGREQ